MISRKLIYKILGYFMLASGGLLFGHCIASHAWFWKYLSSITDIVWGISLLMVSYDEE